MDIRWVTDKFAVSPQIQKADAETIAAAGFFRVVNNRPDGETFDQPTSLHLMTAISNAGVGYLHIPLAGRMISDADIEELRRAIDLARGPVLAFCRSGTRSIILWALSEAGRRPVDEIIARGVAAGYDLEPLRAQLSVYAERAESESAAT